MKGCISMNCVVDMVEYRKSIVSLWNECFGDDREYIDFFIDNCDNKTCLGHIENGALDSMLFLLNGQVNEFSCKYIYAACTAERARGNGLMGSLLEYTKEFCRSLDIDYIFLVPGEESLYSYYSRFGFVTKMVRNDLEIKCLEKDFNLPEIADIGYIAEKRTELLRGINSFSFDRKTTEYTVAEFLYTGGEIYARDGENGFLAFCVRDGNSVTVKELLLKNDSSFTIISNLFKKIGVENVYIHTPLVYNKTDIGGNCTKCGMLYPISDNAKKQIESIDMFYAGMYLD